MVEIEKLQYTQTDTMYIQPEFLIDSFKTAHQQANELKKAGQSISHVTVHRKLKEFSFHNCRPQRKSRLTVAMCKKSLQWAQNHAEWTVEDWSKVRLAIDMLFKIFKMQHFIFLYRYAFLTNHHLNVTIVISHWYGVKVVHQSPPLPL